MKALFARGSRPSMAWAVVWLLALVGCGKAGPGEIARETPVASAAEPEVAPGPEIVDVPAEPGRWGWPAAQAFRDRRAAVASAARVVRLGWGRARLPGAEPVQVALAIAQEEGGTFALWPEFTAPLGELTLAAREGWMLAEGALNAGEFKGKMLFKNHELRLEFDGRVAPDAAPVSDALSDWSYVATLLGDEPLYDPADPWVDYPAEIKKALAENDDARALALYRKHRPVGHCSMDMGPAIAAGEYGEHCFRMGKIGCFLRLRLDIMGDRFERVAYSSFGEASHQTGAARLLDTGVDAARFFRGLAVGFGGVKRAGELPLHRLARSVRESGKAGELHAVFASMAQDPRLDEYNRLRASMVLSLDGELARVAPAARLAPASRFDEVIAKK